MPLAEIVAAEPRHVAELAPNVRLSDRVEIRDGWGLEPATGLAMSLKMSTLSWTGVIGGRVACLFGVAPISVLGAEGAPWLIGSGALDRHPITFLRRCRPMVSEMLEAYPTLINHIDARNLRSIRWLEWLGFDIEPALPWGVAGLPFHRFSLRV